MDLRIARAGLEEIRDLRVIFLHEANMQFVYDKCHYYGWDDNYLFYIDGVKAGYGSVWGQSRREDRDAIFEFFLIEPYRQYANTIFPAFQSACGAAFIECQSNDSLLASMLFQYAADINAEAILFEDHFQTDHSLQSMIFKKNTEGEYTSE